MTGHITRIVEGKGFGFLEADDADHTEYFFHHSACHPSGMFDTLAVGDNIEFTVGEARAKGPRAERVIRIK